MALLSSAVKMSLRKSTDGSNAAHSSGSKTADRLSFSSSSVPLSAIKGSSAMKTPSGYKTSSGGEFTRYLYCSLHSEMTVLCSQRLLLLLLQAVYQSE